VLHLDKKAIGYLLDMVVVEKMLYLGRIGDLAWTLYPLVLKRKSYELLLHDKIKFFLL
jgi:hypothetical protein